MAETGKQIDKHTVAETLARAFPVAGFAIPSYHSLLDNVP